MLKWQMRNRWIAPKQPAFKLLLRIIHETDKAYLVSLPNESCQQWIPKSRTIATAAPENGKDIFSVVMPEWLGKQVAGKLRVAYGG